MSRSANKAEYTLNQRCSLGRITKLYYAYSVAHPHGISLKLWDTEEVEFGSSYIVPMKRNIKRTMGGIFMANDNVGGISSFHSLPA